MPPNQKSNHFLDFVFACFVIALVTGFFFFEDMRTAQFWRGERGWLEVVTPVGAAMAAGLAAFFAWKNYLLGQQKESSDRFERGVKLMDGNSTAMKAAGIIVLEDMALAEPESRHAQWVREYLVSAINEWNQVQADLVPKGATGLNVQPTASHLMRALEALPRLLPSSSPRVRFRKLYLASNSFSAQKMPLFQVGDGLFCEWAFLDCVLDNSILGGEYLLDVEFTNCSLVGSRINVRESSTGGLYFEYCDLRNAKISIPNGADVTFSFCRIDQMVLTGGGQASLTNCWFADQPPVIRNVAALTGALGIWKSVSPKKQPVGPGPPHWTPGDEDQEVAKEAVAPPNVLRNVPKGP